MIISRRLKILLLVTVSFFGTTYLLGTLFSSSYQSSSIRDTSQRRHVIGNVTVGKTGSVGDTVTSNSISVTNEIELISKVQDINRKQVVYNKELHNLSAGSIQLVIFVQVHNRVEELQYLVESLNQVKDNGRCLVIFSHDIYLENVNSVITSLATFPYMQIFFPYSIQLYPKSFPGTDPNDCPRTIYPMSSPKKKCNNFKYPDQYKHYREAKVTQAKHHFLWKMNFVFEKIRILADYKGMFLRLEEDYYIAKDLLHVFKLMNSLRKDRFLGHNMMIMGTHYEKIPPFDEVKLNIVHSRNWCMGSGRGMAFDRRFWQDIKACAKDFCAYDDFAWDWTLWNVARKCMKQPVSVLEIVGSRVVHIGICKGMNHRAGCKVSEIRQQMDLLWDNSESMFFPSELKVEQASFKCVRDKYHPFGGWADPRDVALCYSLMDGDEHVLQKLLTDSSSLLVQKK